MSFPDDQRVFEKRDRSFTSSAAVAVLLNPVRYADVVTVVTIHDATALDLRPDDVVVENTLHHTIEPVETDRICQLLGLCPNIEAINWESPFLPPDGLCEVSG